MRVNAASDPVLTVCIVSYNAVDHLRRSLASVRQFGDANLEVIVVDNNSAAEIRAVIANEFDDVALIENPRNDGYAPAMNIAFGRARGRYLLALSQDAQLQPGAVRTLIDFMEAHQDAGVCAPRTIDDAGQIVTTLHHPNLMLSLWTQIIPVKPWLRRQVRLRRLLTRVFPNSSGMTSDYGTSHEAAVLDGGCLLFRRSALDVVGLLDPCLMQGPDDYDLCFRMHHAGFRTWYVAEAEVIHRTYVKEDVRLLSPSYLRTLLPQMCHLYGKYHGAVWTKIFCLSAYLLALKWCRQVARLHGKPSTHLAAVIEGAAFCLSPSRYKREYQQLWAKLA